ncbi:SIR2 family NAD-dependent protein deacylase [Flavobacterium psychrotrophum]|uniref:SIR2 family NAD-dependent protein deacylase n=1 Tax=Flavobacterium psychrotrophum TaxID=2294119 RepID=UPI000E3189D1|nr:SIR2 family protein [Flavobacterium psychrotrophum]
MPKENLFKHIRSEDVILWAGAGLSLYAGYPSGTELKNIILNDLSQSEKTDINENLPLTDLTEEYCRLKLSSRNSLINILNKTFKDYTPLTTFLHEQIASIPHFKTIVTTNYDSLFENAYHGRSEKIFHSKHIPYLDKNKVHIYKIHGDLSDPDSIIITKDDYNKFFKSNLENNILWTSVKACIASKNILFLGYNLEDSNIQVVFDKIAEGLSLNRKEAFFIAPNLPQSKINWLIQKGIHYINLTGKEFIIELISNIKENIFQDFKNQIVTPDTFRSFTTSNNLKVNIESSESSYALKSISGKNGTLKYNIDFSLNENKNLENFFSGKEFGTVEINEDNLSKFRVTSESGIKILDNDSGRLKLKSKPTSILKIDLSFTNGYEIFSQDVEVYSSQHKIEMRLLLNAGLLLLDANPKPDSTEPEMKIKVSYRLNEKYTLRDGIQFFKTLSGITSGQDVTVRFHGGNSFTKSLSFFEPFHLHSSSILRYFENLKIIEHHHHLNFPEFSIDNITDEFVDHINCIGEVIKYGELLYEEDIEVKCRITKSEKAIQELININDDNKATPLIIDYINSETLNICNIDVEIGKHEIEILEPYISNLAEVIENRNSLVIIKSKVKKYKIRLKEPN